MLKMIIKIVKKIIVAFLILYALNMMLSGFDFIIPINIITIVIITLLGVPGLLGLIAMFFII